MANTYFQFKEFTVNQQGATMKVCTDSCLFGAWVAYHIRKAENILDAGSGTGLLSLMLKQKFPEAKLVAVEKDLAAARQSEQNFQQSPWCSSMKVEATAFEDFNPATAFDLVITNPPFYKNSLPSPIVVKNLAMHETAISLEGWLRRMKNSLSPEGTGAIILPCHRENELLGLMDLLKLKPVRIARVKQTEAHNFFRIMVLLSMDENVMIEEEITIREGKDYSPEFEKLLQPYYLSL